MSFVFISHASQDKLRIKPLIDALLAAGVKVWLDNPAALYSEHEVRQFYRIRAGESGGWRDEINDAKREAACILVCWSKRATGDAVLEGRERIVWIGEADYGQTERKLVACTIDDVSPSALPGIFARDQIPCLDPDQPDEKWRAVMATVLDDIRRVMAGRSDLRTRAKASRDTFAPFLADRTDQENIVHSAVEAALSAGGVRPVLLSGPDNEHPDAFLSRLRRSSADVLRDGGAWLELDAEWPVGAPASGFAPIYLRNLSRGLALPGRSDARELARAIEAKARPVAVIHRLLAKQWGPDEPKRIEAWLKCWDDLAQSAPRMQAVPILQVKMPDAKPGWRKCPGGASGGRVGNRGIWNAANGLSKKRARKGAAVGLDVSPVLGPIDDGHADTWLNRLCPDPGPERARLEQLIRETYRRGAPKRHGVSHREFAEKMAPAFTAPGDGGERGQ
jgi:hypothetical protein